MISGSGTSGGAFGRFLLLLVGVLAGLVVLGYLPTVRLAGVEGLKGMWVGVSISLIGSVIGSIPLVWAGHKGAENATAAILGSMVIRFGLVLALTLLVVLTGAVAKAPLLIWVATSYLAALVVDSRYASKLAATS